MLIWLKHPHHLFEALLSYPILSFPFACLPTFKLHTTLRKELSGTGRLGNLITNFFHITSKTQLHHLTTHEHINVQNLSQFSEHSLSTLPITLGYMFLPFIYDGRLSCSKLLTIRPFIWKLVLYLEVRSPFLTPRAVGLTSMLVLRICDTLSFAYNFHHKLQYLYLWLPLSSPLRYSLLLAWETNTSLILPLRDELLRGLKHKS